MTLIAVLTGLARGVGGSALSRAFDRHREIGLFLSAAVVVVAAAWALFLLVNDHGASSWAFFALLIPISVDIFRDGYSAWKKSRKGPPAETPPTSD